MGSIQEAGSIPVIDLSGPLPQEEIAKQLVDAAATFGFVYIKNEGKDIPIEAIDNIFAQECMPKPWIPRTKEQVFISLPHLHRALAEPSLTAYQKGDFKEAFNMANFQNGKAQQPLPPAFTPHGAEIDQFHKHCHNLMLKILTLFGIGLEVTPPTYFTTRHGNPSPKDCTLRLLHYPPLPTTSLTDFNSSIDIRAGAHSDYGSITLLFQRPGQPGLEIIPLLSTSATPKVGEKDYSNSAPWTPVPVFPPGTENDPSPPILINIGDLLSYWTNNLLKSTVHRVIFPTGASKDRYSIAYFGHPLGDTVLSPIPSERVRVAGLSNGEGVREETGVKAMTANEHLMSRLTATYGNLYKHE